MVDDQGLVEEGVEEVDQVELVLDGVEECFVDFLVLEVVSGCHQLVVGGSHQEVVDVVLWVVLWVVVGGSSLPSSVKCQEA